MAKTNVEEFIAKARKVHGDDFSYEKSMYVNSRTTITITCPIHGDFHQLPWRHLSGKGCRRCKAKEVGETFVLPKERFVEKCRLLHGDKYDYSLAEYTGIRGKVKLICPDHGIFEQYAGNHMRKTGCPQCCRHGVEEMSTEVILGRFKDRHGSRYDYSLITHATLREPVEIVCREHGPFMQKPQDHLRSRGGCIFCGVRGYNRKKPGRLYILRSDSYTKIGITNLSAKSREKDVSKSCGEKFSIVLELSFDNGSTADDSETILLKELRQQYKSPDDKFDGYTECFIGVDLVALIHRVIDVVRAIEQTNKLTINFKE